MPYERYIQMLKVSLPYLSSPVRETCKAIIQISEVKQVMRRLEQEEESLSSCSIEGADPFTEITRAIREFCTPRELEFLDMAANIMQVTKLCRDYENGGND